MNKSLLGIVAIAVVALVFFAIAGYTLSETSPKVKVKVAVERELPVRVRAIETQPSPETRRVNLRVVAAPRGPTLTADEAMAIAVKTATVLMTPGPIPLEYDTLEVAVEGETAPRLRFERMPLERRARLEATLAELAPALAAVYGAPPRLTLVESPNRAFGVALGSRPPAPLDDEAIAAALFKQTSLFAFVRIPAREPGAPPVELRMGPRGVPRR
jgi:hypothetical protein